MEPCSRENPQQLVEWLEWGTQLEAYPQLAQILEI